MEPLRGTFWVLLQYNVSESIDLARLRELLGTSPAQREPRFRHPAPEYVRFEHAPVVTALEGIDGFEGRVRYFEYGIASVELAADFDTDWDGLIAQSSRWIETPELESSVRSLIREHIGRHKRAFVKPYDDWLGEDYLIVRMNPGRLQAPELLSICGDQIAQVVRGESRLLSSAERDEALRSSMSYYRDDLVVAGWLSAFIYDEAEEAAPMVELLEYANSQLLELRHYDQVLTRVLGEVYDLLDRAGGVLRRWRMAREAERLNRIRLDVIELTERSDNSIKFLSDMFYARAYAMAADKIGVSDYRRPVEEKLQTAQELYEFMVNEFHHSRAFILEAMVVAILVIELIYLFRGRG